MPSHFHSAVKSAGVSEAKSLASSIAWASIGVRNGVGSTVSGFGPVPAA